MSHRIDPQIAPHLSGVVALDMDDLPAARKRMREGFRLSPPPIPDGIAVEDRVAVFAGRADVPVRVYRPAGRGAPRAGVLHFHGGGFVVGTHENTADRAMRIAAELDAVVVSVAYRLAPEDPYPAALDDALTAYEALLDDPATWGVDPARLVLHGVSAGAGLAAALALRIRDSGLPSPLFQFLSIPMLDDRMATPSATAFVDTPNWTRSLSERAWRAYLGPLFGAEVPAYAAPSRATDLSGLPPAYIGVAEFDPLRDEGIDYAHRLREAGVAAELHLFPGTFHGSIRFRDAAVSRREADEEIEVLRAALRTHGQHAKEKSSA